MPNTTLAAFAFLAGITVGGAAVATAPAPPAPAPSPPPTAPAAALGPQAVTWEQIEAGTGKGLSKPIFKSRTATLDELEMHVTHLPPGKVPHPPHRHPEEELVILKEGTLEVLQGDKTSRVGPGAVIFQASNQLHGVRNVGDVPATYYVMRWASPGMLKAPAAKP